MKKEYFLVAKDDKTGKPYTWGFYFKSIEAAKMSLLPGTWAVDQDGNKVAEKSR